MPSRRTQGLFKRFVPRPTVGQTDTCRAALSPWRRSRRPARIARRPYHRYSGKFRGFCGGAVRPRRVDAAVVVVHPPARDAGPDSRLRGYTLDGGEVECRPVGRAVHPGEDWVARADRVDFRDEVDYRPVGIVRDGVGDCPIEIGDPAADLPLSLAEGPGLERQGRPAYTG